MRSGFSPSICRRAFPKACIAGWRVRRIRVSLRINKTGFSSSARKPGKSRIGANGSKAKIQNRARSGPAKLFTTLLELPAAPRSLFIFTDGWETQGNVEHLLPAIAGSGLKIYPILPAGPPKIANVAVTKLLAPTYGNSGEALNLKVVLENQNEREVDGTLTLTRNGQTFKTDSVKLKPGSQILTYQTTLSDGSPTSSYRASFTPRRADFDRYAADNQALAWVTVRSKAKVLLLNGRSGGGR